MAPLRYAFISAVVVASFGCKSDPQWPEVGATAPKLEATRHDGAQFDLHAGGTPTLLFFGYTFCPDVCPITLLTLKRLVEALPDGGPVQVVFVTVDPERDTTERMAEYVEGFRIGVAGVRPTNLAKLIDDFRLSVERTGIGTSTVAARYTVNHTASVFVLDGDGRLVAKLKHGSTVESMLAKVAPVVAAAAALMPTVRQPRLQGVGHGTAGLYLTIDNPGPANALVGASSPRAGHVSLHETVVEGDVAKMVEAERWAMPKAGALELAPGGKHVMVMDIDQAVKPGDVVPIELRFERGPPVAVSVELRSLGD